MPRSLLETLGLEYLRTRDAVSSGGPVAVRVFGTVRLTIQERDCPADVTELPDGCPVLIGSVSLHAMDLVVDTSNAVFYKPAMDISAEATAAYDKAFPLGK